MGDFVVYDLLRCLGSAQSPQVLSSPCTPEPIGAMFNCSVSANTPILTVISGYKINVAKSRIFCYIEIMIEIGNIIRPPTSKDIVAEVIMTNDFGTLISWINMGFVSSWYLNNYDRIPPGYDFKGWKVCIENKPKCFRYASWRSL